MWYLSVTRGGGQRRDEQFQRSKREPNPNAPFGTVDFGRAWVTAAAIHCELAAIEPPAIDPKTVRLQKFCRRARNRLKRTCRGVRIAVRTPTLESTLKRRIAYGASVLPVPEVRNRRSKCIGVGGSSYWLKESLGEADARQTGHFCVSPS